MQWEVAEALVDYEDALVRMQGRVRDIRADNAEELIWLVEHSPLYTGGSSAKPTDILDADRFPIYETGRGGQYTYHGPGQRVAYVMLDLKARAEKAGGKPDIRAFVKQLEQWLINTLAHFSVIGHIREGRVGVWVETPYGEKKIAALGIRLHQWVSFHGIALNVHPDLSHYEGIVPCGISNYGVTSLHDLGQSVSMVEVDEALKKEAEKLFGPINFMTRNNVA